jgi:hypothetical protein
MCHLRLPVGVLLLSVNGRLHRSSRQRVCRHLMRERERNERAREREGLTGLALCSSQLLLQ